MASWESEEAMIVRVPFFDRATPPETGASTSAMSGLLNSEVSLWRTSVGCVGGTVAIIMTGMSFGRSLTAPDSKRAELTW